MTPEQRARWHSRRVIISEILMVIAVIATVSVLALVVSGYWLNSDFEVERQGLLQVSSIPTGANVEIDGTSSWLQRTNTSKVLSTGTHTVKLTRDGYDSWSKTINIKEGLLYRIHYPRLFLKERTKEELFSTAGTTFASISPDRRTLLLINNTTEWKLVNLDSDKPTSKPLNIANIFSSVSLAPEAKTGLFSGQILDADWDHNSEHILLKVGTESGVEWVLLNVGQPASSINITREFAASFADVQILDNSASNLLAIRDGNLHKIDVGGRQISAIIAEKVHSFDHFENQIVFVGQITDYSKLNIPEGDDDFKTSPDDAYYIGFTKVGSGEISTLATLSSPALITISKFYDDEYISILQNSQLTVYEKESFKEHFKSDISFTPSNIKIGHDGEFIFMNEGTSIASFDMEAGATTEWVIDSANNGWLDDDMLYSVNEGELAVYDFDGLNKRVLASNASSHYPVAITNDKWLYYFSDDMLAREIVNN